MHARRLELAGFALIALVAACAPQRPPLTPDLPFAGVDGAHEIPVGSLARPPSGLSGKTVRTRGKVTGGGRVSEGVWIELQATEQPAGTARLLVPPGMHADALLGYEGRVVELSLRVDGPIQLSDGETALAVEPIQYAARFGDAPQSAAATGIQQDIDQASVEVSQQLKQGQTETFGDPGFASGASEPKVRLVFLDPNLDRPRWSIMGPVSIERSGSSTAPEYVYTAIMRSQAGDVRESVCRFRIEQGALRSVSYDETIRDAQEQIKDDVHVDYTGEYLDKRTETRVPYPDNVYPSACLGFALSGFPFGEKVMIDFHLWSDLESAAPMEALVDREERVTVPAGTFDTYRMRMRFDEEKFLAQLALPAHIGYEIARSMMSQLRQVDTVLWITKSKPHLVVKTEGPLGPPGTTRGALELLEIPPEARATTETVEP